MEKWQKEDCERVAELFRQVGNRAAFAREHSVPGGQAMIYQHINLLRPVGLDAAVAYAKGFHVTLSSISPVLAAKVEEVLKVEAVGPITVQDATPGWPFRDIQKEQWKALDAADKGRVEGYAISLITKRPNDKSHERVA